MNEEIRTISELVAGEALFDSRGFSIVKVTKDGVESKIKLPIKSTGVAEYQEELAGKAPIPPVTIERIDKDSKRGRETGLKRSEMHTVYDTTDKTYIEALEKHNQDFLWRIVIFALDIKWTKADGGEGKSFDEKKAILRSNGITGHHIDKIYNDVILLTQFAEDRQDFLSKRS